MYFTGDGARRDADGLLLDHRSVDDVINVAVTDIGHRRN